ncbi:hypothetical protein RZS08_65955, partial [Arthrospira platensis SPKY1]|nr:hypothetical protein [Arthrospira platensis SPKY1]
TIEYTLTDGVNTVSCSFTVTVIDTEAPVIAGCTNPLLAITFDETANAACTYTFPNSLRTITDNCDAEITAEMQFTNPDGSIAVLPLNSLGGNQYSFTYTFELGVTTYVLYAE